MKFWLNHPKHGPDSMLTISVYATFIVLLKVLLNGVKITDNLDFGTIDAALAGAVLAATLGAYVSRKWTDKKFGDKEKD